MTDRIQYVIIQLHTTTTSKYQVVKINKNRVSYMSNSAHLIRTIKISFLGDKIQQTTEMQ